MSEGRFIDIGKRLEEWGELCKSYYPDFPKQMLHQYLLCAPTADVVSADDYENLRIAFVDYVCSGTQNPAPYCKNRHPDCVTSYGWCIKTGNKCRGFNPDGRKENGID